MSCRQCLITTTLHKASGLAMQVGKLHFLFVHAAKHLQRASGLQSQPPDVSGKTTPGPCALCGAQDIIVPFSAVPCGHTFCYYCLRTNCEADFKFQCTVCDEKVAAMRRWAPPAASACFMSFCLICCLRSLSTFQFFGGCPLPFSFCIITSCLDAPADSQQQIAMHMSGQNEYLLYKGVRMPGCEACSTNLGDADMTNGHEGCCNGMLHHTSVSARH